MEIPQGCQMSGFWPKTDSWLTRPFSSSEGKHKGLHFWRSQYHVLGLAAWRCWYQNQNPASHSSTLVHQFSSIRTPLKRDWEKAMAPYSSTLAWRIPWTEKPGRLQSMKSLRVGHDWATSLSLFTFMHWRRKWQPTPVFLPGESQGRGSLVGCPLWGCTESNTTEVTQQHRGTNTLNYSLGPQTWAGPLHDPWFFFFLVLSSKPFV